MKTSLPDDIARLTRDAEFDFAGYQVFDRAPRHQQPAPEILDRGPSRTLALSPAIQPVRATEPALPRSGPTAVIRENTSLYPRESPKDGGHCFRALDELTLEATSPHRNIRNTTVALFPSSGGCGVTTIAATLGRVLSDRNEPVVLVDQSPQSLLGAYFGIRGFRPGIRSIVRAGGEPGANVHVVSQSNPTASDWLAEVANQLDGEFERMIVDVSSHFTTADLQRILKGAAALIPLVPDLRTVCRLEPLLDRLGALAAGGEVKFPIYLVLSQFDANVRLHCEIRDWLRQTYGAMLLPFSLRRGDEVSEALADGATVIDYAPNSGIAQDFRSLAGWAQQLPRMETGS